MHTTEKAPLWDAGPNFSLSARQFHVMGILNVTPDSFSDGGAHSTVRSAIGHSLRMIEESAAIIDVGGESTRPGAARVDVAEQIKRTVPVIEELRRAADVLISIDTTQSDVAQAALDCGADIINDISAGRDDPRMFTVASRYKAGVVLMHRLARPEDDSFSNEYTDEPVYDDVVLEVRAFLKSRCDAAIDAGIKRSSIVIDPGLGFGKSVAHNYELIRRAGELLALGFPMLSAASRKSFVGSVTGRERTTDRLVGSTAISVAHYLAGVRLFRVHDVGAHADALRVAQAVGGEIAV